VPVDVVLTWTAGARAESHDVYFGANPDLGNDDFQGNQTATSFVPPPLEYSTTYYWRVDEVRTGSGGSAIVTAGEVLSFTTAPAPAIDIWRATGERTGKGFLMAGDYLSTYASDDSCEILQEIVNVSNKNGYSILDHTWTFEVGGGSVAEFYVEAFHSESSDGDDFVFSYSEDGEIFTTMLTVSKTVDTDTPQIYKFPGGISGTITVRVQDADHSKGSQAVDTLHVDAMHILTSTGAIVHYEASKPSPGNGSEDVALDATLSWTAGEQAIAHNVYFASDREYLELISENQTATECAPPAALLPLTTYYWRVDEVREGGLVTTGTVWLFTTTYQGECAPETMEIESVVTSTERGSGGCRFGLATVTVVDNCGSPVAGATVYGDFVGDFTDEVYGDTNDVGVVVFRTATEVKKPLFGFVVTGVQHDILTY
jgi:hypothetical protein